MSASFMETELVTVSGGCFFSRPDGWTWAKSKAAPQTPTTTAPKAGAPIIRIGDPPPVAQLDVAVSEFGQTSRDLGCLRRRGWTCPFPLGSLAAAEAA